MAHEARYSFIVVAIVVFSCFNFTLVSVSWILNGTDVNEHILKLLFTLYCVIMIVGIGTIIRDYVKYKQQSIRRDTATEHSRNSTQITDGSTGLSTTPRVHYKTKKVQSCGIVLFSIGVVILDILTIVDVHVQNLQCPRTADNFVKTTMYIYTIMLSIRVVYVCVQVVYVLWMTQRIKTAQIHDVGSSSLIINLAVNITLLIHSLLFENQVLFHDRTEGKGSRCLETYGSLKSVGITEEVLMPFVIEFFFLSCSWLYEQWEIIEHYKAELESPEPRDTVAISHTNYGSCRTEIHDVVHRRQTILTRTNTSNNITMTTISLPSSFSLIKYLEEKLVNVGHLLLTSKWIHYVIFVLIIVSTVIALAVGRTFNGHIAFKVIVLLTYILVAVGYGTLLRFLLTQSCTHPGSYDVAITAGTVVLLICTAGFYLHNLSYITPFIVSFAVKNVSFVIRNDPNVTAYVGDNFTLVASMEIATGLWVMFVAVVFSLLSIMIHADLHDGILWRVSPVGMKYVMINLIAANFSCWLYKSFFFCWQVPEPIQTVFFGEANWQYIEHLVVPLEVYFHFHVALVSTECLVDHKVDEVAQS